MRNWIAMSKGWKSCGTKLQRVFIAGAKVRIVSTSTSSKKRGLAFNLLQKFHI